jgi:hypothetical protein
MSFSTKKGDSFGFIRDFLSVPPVVRQPDDFPRKDLLNCLAHETKELTFPVESHVLPLRIYRLSISHQTIWDLVNLAITP